MKIIALIAFAALLSACSTVAPNSVSSNALGEYTVVQDGTTYTFDGSGGIGQNGITIRRLYLGTPGVKTGYAYSNADVEVAGGRVGGNNYAVLSGTQTTGMGTSGTLNLNGLYGLNDNGSFEITSINLTADLAAGTLTGSTPGTNVNGTITGATVSGTFDRNGASSTFNGGFYGPAVAPTMAATITGTNLAGILVVD